MYFIDSSALVKAYVTEPGSPAVRALIASRESSIYISSQVMIETAAAIARLRRTRDIRHRVYAQGREHLLNHCNTRFHVVHPPASLITAAVVMIDSYRMRSVGGSDLLHIATAEYIQKLRPGTISFMCCDARLRNVAEERGLVVFDPERDPLTAL